MSKEIEPVSKPHHPASCPDYGNLVRLPIGQQFLLMLAGLRIPFKERTPFLPIFSELFLSPIGTHRSLEVRHQKVWKGLPVWRPLNFVTDDHNLEAIKF